MNKRHDCGHWDTGVEPCQECRAIMAEGKLSAAVNLRDEWQKRFEGQQVIIDSLRDQLAKMEDGRDTWRHEAQEKASRLASLTTLALEMCDRLDGVEDSEYRLRLVAITEGAVERPATKECQHLNVAQTIIPGGGGWSRCMDCDAELHRTTVEIGRGVKEAGAWYKQVYEEEMFRIPKPEGE